MAQSEVVGRVTAALEELLQGKAPPPVAAPDAGSEDEVRLVETLNRLIASTAEIRQFVLPLSRGEFDDVSFSPTNYLASPMRELESRLRHLTWQAQQVTKGDLSQRVDFMGDFSQAFNTMVAALDAQRSELRRRIRQLEDALAQVKRLEGLLPTCAKCGHIRSVDDSGETQWEPIETYVANRTDARFSHTICPDCMRELYPEYADRATAGPVVAG